MRALRGNRCRCCLSFSVRNNRMSEFDAAEHEFMAQALRLAERGRYTARPNPCVGCVLVNDGRIVGEGWHQKTGDAHAEINALKQAGKSAAGSTAYVTLEPCSHTGKTPPCVDALLDAKVVAVVIAMLDPNPKVSGTGVTVLEDAGIEVRVGLMQSEAHSINRGFISRMTRGRPFVRLKIAASLDGCTAMASGESQWITSEPARHDVQRLRASAGAILTGIDTVLADDPSLTVRDTEIPNDGAQPLRVVVDSRLRMFPSARMLKLPGNTLIYCVAGDGEQTITQAGAEVCVVTGAAGRVDASLLLADLASREINDVLVEAGPTLSGSLLEAKLVDELVIYQAPHIMGSETRGMVTTPAWRSLQQRLELEILDIRKIGVDIRIIARPMG